MFHPGVTAVHAFTIPFKKENIAKVIVSYWQDDHIVLERTLTSERQNEFNQAFDLPMQDWSEEEKRDKSKFFIQFTQNESLLFADKSCALIQINVLTTLNSRHTSTTVKRRDIDIQLHREVMKNG